MMELTACMNTSQKTVLYEIQEIGAVIDKYSNWMEKHNKLLDPLNCEKLMRMKNSHR